ncbi:MAG: hypothetical protein AB7K24_29935 [Gemmataceae bacterium]
MADIELQVPCWYGQEASTRDLPIGKGRLFQGIATGNSVCVAFYVEKRDASKMVERNSQLELVEIPTYRQLRKVLTELQAEGASEIVFIQGTKWRALEINKAIITAALADD